MWIHTQNRTDIKQWEVKEHAPGQFVVYAHTTPDVTGLPVRALTVYLSEAEVVDLVTELAKAVGRRGDLMETVDILTDPATLGAIADGEAS